jgi:type IV pilus assembly protein PilF
MNSPRLWLASALVLTFVSACNTVSPGDVALADSHRNFADVKLSQGEPEIAIKEYQKAIALHPNDVESHYGLAEAYRAKNMLSDTERELREVLRLAPTHHEARLALGVAYLQMERWNDAAAEFATLAQDPTFVRPSRALVNLGWAHYKSGDLEAAKLQFERALRADPANHVAHLDLGIVFYDKGELVEAIRHFEEAVNLIAERPVQVFGPAEAEARYRMAQAYLRLGQRDRAVDTLRVAVERGGESEWGRKSTDYLKVLQ